MARSSAETGGAAAPRNFLRPCVLLLLREQSAHGYDLIERLRPLGFDPSDPGRLYRTLRALEDEALVRSGWEASSVGPDRRVYEITRAGVEHLHDHARSLADGRELLTIFLSRYEEFAEVRRPPRGAVRRG